MKLFMVMLGCRPKGRFTEQHDVFFGIGNTLKDLIPEMKAFWPEAKGKIHVDVWREVTAVENCLIEIIAKKETEISENQLFFINLGGYKENEFEEFHYKMLAVGNKMSDAVTKSKATTFYKHCGFKGATSHIDDKFGIDIDDIYNVREILELDLKDKFSLKITKSNTKLIDDKLHVGYLKLEKIV
ncbi:MAG: DUF1543 domain-containing protein [Flavobacterium sp.]|nr:DUF1543 domain-containing protein [Flavobacterium sp.]